MANTKVKAEQLEAAQTNITSVGTLTALTVDDITIDGSTISDGGDLTIDVAGDINLDADGGDINFKDGGTTYGFASKYNNDLWLGNSISDGDVTIRGNDGGSSISALTFDMSAGGAATFNSDVTTGGKLTISDGGNATVAAIRFNAGLGISSPSTDQMNFITADTSRMVISSAGMVTITPDSGATTGTLRLHNGNGNGTLGAVEFGYSTNVDHGSIQYTGNMDFFTGDSDVSRFFISSAGLVGINTSSPEHHLHVTEPGSTKEDGIVKIGGSSTALGLELRYNQTGHTTTQIVANPTYTNTQSVMKLCVDGDANADQLVLTGGGNVGIGGTPVQTSSGYDGAQLHIRQSATNGGAQLYFTEGNGGHTNSDGMYLSMWNDGHVYFVNNHNGALKLYMDAAHRHNFSKDYYYPENDDQIDIGLSNRRFDDIYATSGTVNSSDETLKRDINALSEAEKAVALKIKGLMRTFRWKNSYEKKGEDARYHTGVVAQQVEALFKEEGLDISKYAFWVKGVYYVDSEGKEIVDEYGSYITPGTDPFEKVTDKKEAYRYSIRYDQLLCFIIGAM